MGPNGAGTIGKAQYVKARGEDDETGSASGPIGLCEMAVVFCGIVVEPDSSRSPRNERCLASRLTIPAEFRFHSLGSGEFPVSVWLGARSTRVQFTNFPDRRTTSGTRHG